MAKLFNGMIPFASAIKPTGAQPLDDRTVVKSFSDLLSDETFGLAKYNGMLVAVVDDQQVYMLINDKNSTSEESWVAVGSGNGSLAVETYTEAVELATNDNIGQVIYVKTKSSYDADGEGEGEAVEYEAAPYIVIGEKSLMKLAASSASGSIEGEVAELTTKIGTAEQDIDNLEAVVGDSENGLVKDVADLKTAVDNIEVPVKDVTVDGTSVLNEEGVAVIELPSLEPYATKEEVKEVSDNLTEVEGRVTSAETRITEVETAVSTKVEQVEGSRLMSETEGTKLAGIAEGAQVNVIEGVKVNGTALEIGEDKLVNIEIEAPKVKGVDGADKMLSLTENGEVKSELSIKYVKAEDSEDNTPRIALFGKGGTTLISTIDATDFVKDGMISSVRLVDTADNKKELEIVWNTDAGKETVNVDVTSLLDYYYAGDGIAFNEETRKFSVDLKEGETFLVVDAAGLGIDTTALWSAADAKYDKINAAATAEQNAKDYADGVAGTAEQNAKDYADGVADTAEQNAKDYADGVADTAEQNAKAYTDELAGKVYTKEESNNTFVTKEGFNEFEAEYEEKLNGIAAGAEVNVVETVKVNGIDATITDKVAEVKIEANDIELGTAILNGEEVKYEATAKVSDVLQSIQESIRGAIAGGVNSVAAADKSIVVNSADANNPTVKVNVSLEANNLLKLNEDGLFVAMYYDGDDTENI